MQKRCRSTNIRSMFAAKLHEVFPVLSFFSMDASNQNGISIINNNQQHDTKKEDQNGSTTPNKISRNIQDLRKCYLNKAEPFLLEHNMSEDPFKQFDLWFKNVVSKTDLRYEEVNAVSLSTVKDNKPSSRMVLLKRYDEKGFIFFTHSISRKGQELQKNPYASMLIYWPKVDRQIRIEGIVEALVEQEAEDYWKRRPIASRIGSKLSKQSSVIPSRNFLEMKQKELEKAYTERGEEAITRPEDWLGYILIPEYFEFWQGQSDRIHDRIIYEKSEQNAWMMNRLSP